jgi:hypothetical protein
MNFKSKFQPGWDALFKALPVADIGFLSINPSAVKLDKPTGTNSILNVAGGITARPVFSLTDPGVVTPTPLPDISAVDGNGFNVYVDMHLQYAEFTALLKKNLSGKRITIDKKGFIDIRDISVSGIGNDHLIVKVDFHGKYKCLCYNGSLYFDCLPQYDGVSRELVVSDINLIPSTEQSIRGPRRRVDTQSYRDVILQKSG